MRPLYVGNRRRHDGAELGVESARNQAKDYWLSWQPDGEHSMGNTPFATILDRCRLLVENYTGTARPAEWPCRADA